MKFQLLKIDGFVEPAKTIVFDGLSSDIKSQKIHFHHSYVLSIEVIFLDAESCHLE